MRERAGARRGLVLAAVGVGTFMSALDASIVSVALPVIRQDFTAPVASVEWVVTMYLLVVSATLLGFGRLGDLRGHKASYLGGFAIFTGASVLCALAPSLATLTAFRAVQAIGAAMLFANAPAILTATFPPERRGRVLGLQAAMTYLGLTVGPPLGGFLVGALTWRAIFFVNLPIGLMAAALAFGAITADRSTAAEEGFDFLGAGSFGLGLAALLLALNRGHDWGWGSPGVLGLAAAALAFLGAFLFRERRAPHPMLDLSLFRDRTFSSSTAAALLNYVAAYSIVFLMPFYLIQGRGLQPGRAGLLLAVQSLVMALVAPLSGALSDRVGSRWLAAAGMLVLACAMLLLSRLDASAPAWSPAAPLALAGLGVGLFVSPNSSAMLGAVPARRRGIASAVLAEARNVGMVLGVGVAGAVFTANLAGRAPGPTPELFAGISSAFAVAAVVALAAAAVSALQRP